MAKHANDEKHSVEHHNKKEHHTPKQEQSPPRMKSQSRGRWDIIVFVGLAILLFFVVKHFINPTEPTAETNPYDAMACPVLSEVMSSNRDALPAEDGEYYDWIELYNPTDHAINLKGFSLSDDIENPERFVFSDRILEPHAYTIIYASGKDSLGDNHANFCLCAKGEDLYLFDAHQCQRDHITIEHLPSNTTYAWDETQASWMIKEHYTPGFSNDEAGFSAFLSTREVHNSPLFINEAMSSNCITLADSEGEYHDWVEIGNNGDQPIHLKGYGLSDSKMSTRKWIFPDVTIHPNEYLLVFLSGKDMVTEYGELHASFRLNTNKEDLIISNIQGQILDHWKVEGLDDDRSLGRIKGTDTTTIFAHPTPGFDNTEDGYNLFQDTSPKIGLLISEVQLGNAETIADNFNEYSDWIELYNNSDEEIDLSGYGLTDSPSQLGLWKFPDKCKIKPHEYKVIFASGRDYRKGRDLHTNFKLDMVGEPVVLTAPDDSIVDTCVLAPMPFDMSYGRTDSHGLFAYMPHPTPGDKNGTGWSGFAADPIPLVQGGNYADPVVVSFHVAEGTKVYYTTDCSDPSEHATLYQGPFSVDQTTVVRARAYADDKLPGSIVTATYFIGLDHKLPVVSLVSDPDNLFSDHSGIYAFGTNFNRKKIPFKGANFNQDWEVPAHIEMYEIDGSQVLDQGFGLRIFGAYSRAEIAKSFTLVARQKYDQKEMLEHAIFPDLPYTSYKSVILRNGASEWYASKIRDSLLTSLVDTTDLEVQAHYPVVVYLNGKYWGVYFFREKINKYYLQQHYGIDPESVDILYANGKPGNALVGDNQNWSELKAFVTSHDLSDTANYEEVARWVDIDNYMDMVINEIYVGNSDTGNIKYYRERREDAKWRWFYYDVDWGYFYTKYANAHTNNLKQYLNPKGHGANDAFETWLIMGLLDNPDFKQQFIDRFAYHINVTYDPTRVIERIDELAATLDPEMPQDREHWNAEYEATPQWYKDVPIDRSMSYKGWLKNIDRLRDFATKRPDAMRMHLVSYFDISKEDQARLFGD